MEKTGTTIERFRILGKFENVWYFISQVDGGV
jgi:hypothetical protein